MLVDLDHNGEISNTLKSVWVVWYNLDPRDEDTHDEIALITGSFDVIKQKFPAIVWTPIKNSKGEPSSKYFYGDENPKAHWSLSHYQVSLVELDTVLVDE